MKKLSILILVVSGVALLELLPAPKAAAYFQEHRGGRVWGGVVFGGPLINPYLGGGGYNTYGGYGYQNYGGSYIYGGQPVYRTYPTYGGGYYFNPGRSYPSYQTYRYGPYPGYGYGLRGYYE